MKEKTKNFLENISRGETFFECHPCDDKRFDEFIIIAYRNGDKNINYDEFCGIIENCFPYKNRVNENELERLFIRYEKGVELLEIYNEIK